MVRLEFGFDEEKITGAGFNADEAYSTLRELAITNSFTEEEKGIFICVDDEAGFVGAMIVVMAIIEENYWFKPFFNVFNYKDEETEEELIDELLNNI